METETAAKEGYLYIPPQNFLRKTWLKRYCALYNASNHGIQRLEVFENEDSYVKQNSPKIIPLVDCLKVSHAPQKQQPNVFEVRTKDNCYQFSTNSFQEMSEWLLAFQTSAFKKPQNKMVVSDSSTNEGREEENTLYCSMDKPENFPVKILATEAATRNRLKGDYKLILTSMSFSIAEEGSLGRSGRIILTWPYRHIRRYGCNAEKFSFEAGRKCASGEGLFAFITNEGAKIFQSVDNHVFALKNNQTDIPKSPSANDSEAYFFAYKDDSISHIVNKMDEAVTLTPVDVVGVDLNHKNSFKSIPPITKPPRKSKSNVSKEVLSMVSKGFNVNAWNSNDYAQVSNNDSNETHTVVARAAFKEHVEISKTKSVPDTSQLHFSTEKAAMNVYNEAVGAESKSLNESVFKSEKLHSSGAAHAEHVYGKLMTVRPAVSDNSNFLSGSIMDSTSDRNSNFNNDDTSQYGKILKTEAHPYHFIKNDSEYAQVLKRN